MEQQHGLLSRCSGLVDRNPQTFVDNIATAKADDFKKATQCIYCTGEAASSLMVQVLGEEMPSAYYHS